MEIVIVVPHSIKISTHPDKTAGGFFFVITAFGGTKAGLLIFQILEAVLLCQWFVRVPREY